MALIQCPDCHADISDVAPACIKCGRPMQKTRTTVIPPCPDFPADLSIGKAIANWLYDTAVQGHYQAAPEETNPALPDGKARVMLHEYGLGLYGSYFKPLVAIHFLQLISLAELKGTAVMDKSVVGRAVVGGVLLGPLGAVVSGISGIGEKTAHRFFLVINYWNVASREPQTISVASKESVKRFTTRVEKDRAQAHLPMDEREQSIWTRHFSLRRKKAPAT